ncbi:MAG: amidohydrolase family protein [Ignavibacteria bacterium]|jgi:cytosine/adenosine deaminase-related metal-dependent hydrolase
MKIINTWICQIKKNSIIPTYGDLEIVDGIIKSITARNIESTSKIKKGGDDIIDVEGRLLTIPQINFHDHFYSRLAKGLPLKGKMDNFHNILKNLWWKLDVELDIDMVRACAQMAVMESIRNGVTYIFDHHSSPNYSKGSLKEIADVLTETGLNGVLCFETTDRNGLGLAKSGLDENKDFLNNHTRENIKAMLGLHASFTLSEESLLNASELMKENDLGIHIHLCEDKIDREESIRQFNLSPVERLNNHDLLNDKSILSHGIHLTEDDYKKVSAFECAIAYNPDSNMNNSVGLASFNIPSTIQIIMGTDGMHSNPSKSLKQLFLLSRHSGNSFEESFTLVQRIFFDQVKFVKKYFPSFSLLAENERADFIIWDYIPPTPVTKENFWGHFIYGAIERSIHSVLNNGTVLLKDYKINVDEERYNSNTIKQGNRLYKKLLNT